MYTCNLHIFVYIHIDLFAKVNEEQWPLRRHNIVKLTYIGSLA